MPSANVTNGAFILQMSTTFSKYDVYEVFLGRSTGEENVENVESPPSRACMPFPPACRG